MSKTTKRSALVTDVVTAMATCMTATTRDSYIAGGLFSDCLEVVTGRSKWAESYVAKLDQGNSAGKLVAWTRFQNQVVREAKRNRDMLISIARHDAELAEIATLIGESANRDAIADAVRTYGFHTVRANVMRALATK